MKRSTSCTEGACTTTLSSYTNVRAVLCAVQGATVPRARNAPALFLPATRRARARKRRAPIFATARIFFGTASQVARTVSVFLAELQKMAGCASMLTLPSGWRLVWYLGSCLSDSAARCPLPPLPGRLAVIGTTRQGGYMGINLYYFLADLISRIWDLGRCLRPLERVEGAECDLEPKKCMNFATVFSRLVRSRVGLHCLVLSVWSPILVIMYTLHRITELISQSGINFACASFPPLRGSNLYRTAEESVHIVMPAAGCPRFCKTIWDLQ